MARPIPREAPVTMAARSAMRRGIVVGSVENRPTAPTSPHEIHAAHLPEPRELGRAVRRRAQRGHERGDLDHEGAHRVRRVDRRGGPGRRVQGQARGRARRCPRGHRRPVRRGQGAPRRLLPVPDRHRGARARGRQALARRPPLGGRAAPADGRVRDGDVTADPPHEDLLRRLAPQVLGALVHRFGRFDACEDAVQEALLAAAVQWPDAGGPDHPRAWLLTVAARRLTDEVRAQESRRRREGAVAAEPPPGPVADEDDTLALLFLCCHPALSPAAQVALTLRAVGGLTTAQIAHAFLVPEATMAQRISRAKQRIRAAGQGFEPPPDPERAERLRVVLHVLYLIFNEGYSATAGPDLQRVELTREAIRLTRAVHALRPDDGEVAGLLALMLLTDARRAARTTAAGALVPLAEQDRALWDRAEIEEGVALVSDTLARAPVGPYQLQAAIAAVHAEAPSANETDWPQILTLYRLLERVGPNPIVTLNHAVALAMVDGPRAGLELLATLDGDARVADHHRLEAVRAHLLELAGDHAAALRAYRTAARRSTSTPERRHLEGRAARLASSTPPTVKRVD